MLIIAVSVYNANADLVPYICEVAEGSEGLESIEAFGACVGFKIRSTSGEEKTVKLGFNGSGFFKSLDGGKSVIFFHSFPYAKLTKNGDIVYLGTSEKPKNRSVTALVFFREGVKVASYDIEDLLVRTRLVGLTASHILWLISYEELESKGLNKELTVSTSSLRRYTFDVKTGKMLRKGNYDEWDKCDVVANGGIHMDENGIQMLSPRILKPSGMKRKELLIYNPDKVEIERFDRQTLCLRSVGGRYVLSSVVLSGFLYNGL
jgi:hypothetical protein